MGIKLEKRGRREPTLQLNARIDPELVRRVRIFAVTRGVQVASMVEAGLRVVLKQAEIVGETGAKAKAAE